MTSVPTLSSPLADYPVTAPPLRRPVVFDQRWTSLAFLHWPVRPETVAHLYPRGSRPDVWVDGLTYVGLVPFEMRDAGFGRNLPVPFFGRFLETNIRLYSVDDGGRHGVLFRSLETERLAIVPFARGVFGIPYTYARMTMRRDGDVVRYDSVRRWPRAGLASHLSLRIGEPVDPTDLEVWLTARWGAHTRVAGRTWWVPNEHDAWPLQAAEVLDLRDDLMAAAGVEPAGPPLRALWTPGVRTRFGRPSLVR
ncbi:MAG: YqjF family protein [Jatrophihabitans sp.]|uniref:YqjF family protein n=1 Tax=Jatrophihabitans sp. TaxID=1932789 RepID=UPI003F7F9345